MLPFFIACSSCKTPGKYDELALETASELDLLPRAGPELQFYALAKFNPS